MKTKFLTLVTFLFCVCASNVNAQIRKTQRHERHRIAQGVKSGELTRNEKRILASQQRDIRQDKKEARADGVVTSKERKEINKEQRTKKSKPHYL
ncbi:MAG: hypothetical protein ABIO76_11315 [Ginsengibacter sp.]